MTGIEYPKITLGGIEYDIKFTRGVVLYRLSKLEVDVGNLFVRMNFGKTIDALYGTMHPPFPGTQEELADLVTDENKIVAVAQAITEALGKAFPSPQPAPQATPDMLAEAPKPN